MDYGIDIKARLDRIMAAYKALDFLVGEREIVGERYLNSVLEAVAFNACHGGDKFPDDTFYCWTESEKDRREIDAVLEDYVPGYASAWHDIVACSMKNLCPEKMLVQVKMEIIKRRGRDTSEYRERLMRDSRLARILEWEQTKMN